MFPPTVRRCTTHRVGEIMTGSTNERWLTYVEVGELLGCTLTAARMHAKRRGWPRHSPNMIGDRSRVLVPDDVVARQHEQRRSPSTADCYRADGSDRPARHQPHQGRLGGLGARS